MRIIHSNSETLLLATIEELHQKNHAWYIIEVYLSRLSSVTNAAQRTLVNTINEFVGDHEVTLYACQNHDIVLLLQNTPLSLAPDIVKEVSFLFADDPLLHSQTTESGNELCTIYKTKEDHHKFHMELFERQAALNIKISDVDPLRDAASYTPDQVIFTHALLLRKMRNKLCVMIVEDQRFSRQMVIAILGLDFEVIAAGDGREALQLYEANAPDIVFLDIDLPGMDGQMLLEYIVHIDPQSFVVMLTANRTKEGVQRALSHHAKGYIVKPFNKQKIDQYLKMYYQTFPEKMAKTS